MLRALPFLIAATPLFAHAQTPEAWQACTAIDDSAQRLACYDQWARGQRPAPTAVPAAPGPAPSPADMQPVAPPVPAVVESRRGFRLTATDGCRDPRYSELSRFWELERGADCGTFGLRGYRPTSLDMVDANRINQQPTSENPLNNATTATDYRTTEMRLSLSVRTKIAQGLFSYRGDGMDSLWFAYSQQSYWQLFTPQLSRPFRSTDHEPEVLYVAPVQSAQPGTWRMRMAGIGLVHQSNGQSLPLSRSWNRWYVMGGFERDNLQLQARLWDRINESRANDDNPGISNYIGRGELVARWQPNRANLFMFTGRHALTSGGHGSVRLEWFRTLADTGIGVPNGLRLHTQLFSGYGDTLLDYNFKRTVLSIGFSLVEW
jgi:phospholipase A1/A2